MQSPSLVSKLRLSSASLPMKVFKDPRSAFKKTSTGQTLADSRLTSQHMPSRSTMFGCELMEGWHSTDISEISELKAISSLRGVDKTIGLLKASPDRASRNDCDTSPDRPGPKLSRAGNHEVARRFTLFFWATDKNLIRLVQVSAPKAVQSAGAVLVNTADPRLNWM